MAYIGKAPNTAIVNQATSQSFSGNGSTTAFTLTRSVNVGEDLEVFVNNVQQEPGSGKSYTASGTTLTFDEAPPSGTNNVYVIYRGEATINPRLEHDANAALAATTGTFSGDLTVDTSTLKVNSSNNRVGIGTSSPDEALHIEKGANSSIRLGQQGGDYAYRLRANVSGSVNGGFLIEDAVSKNDLYNVRSGSSGFHKFSIDGTEAMQIDSSGRVGIGTASPADELHVNSTGVNVNLRLTRDTNTGCRVSGSDGGTMPAFIVETIASGTATERVRIDSSGHLLHNTTNVNVFTSNSSSLTGLALRKTSAGSRLDIANTASCIQANRVDSHGDLIVTRYDGNRRGALMTSSTTGQACLQGGNVGITFTTNGRLNPTNSSGAASDNAMDLGQSDKRFDDIYATNGNIQTSDQNEKQQIASLTTAEITAAKAISKLFKTFKWNSAVEEKGDAARTHSGVIAQDVQQAMTDAGLDASDYAFFISDTWWETDEVQTDDEGVEHPYKMPYYTAEEAPERATQRTRLGVRYPELLAFIGAATEQRLADIETRLTALEK